MSKFTNVDYNKNLLYNDSNPFADTFKEKYEEGKNIAIDAYNKKVDSAVSEGLYEIRKELMGPRYEELILNKGTDAEMLNPKFYDLMNATPESIMERVRAKGSNWGINPKSIKAEQVMTDELKLMKDAAVRQHYDELAKYADEHGDGKLQKLLDREGDKFATFYRKFTDPYASEARGALWVNTGPGAESGATQRALAKKYPFLAADIANGMRFKEDDKGNVYATSGFMHSIDQADYNLFGNSQITPGYGSQIHQDEYGRYYYDTSWDPISSLLSNVFGSGLIDMNRTYLSTQDNPDEWFWWAQ